MKLFLSLLTLIFAQTIWASPQYNLLLIDSSYPPLTNRGFSLSGAICPLMNEDNQPIPQSGDCYEKEIWNELKKVSPNLINGIMDHFANQDSADRKTYLKAIEDPQQKTTITQIKQAYTLASHGTRSAIIAWENSGHLAKILPLRSVTSRSATGKSQEHSKTQSQKKTDQSKYDNECSLINWSPQQTNEFLSHNKIQDYQLRISEILKANPGIRVINISLGYKKPWIQEDNLKCNTKQIDKEYAILKASWKSLLLKYLDRIFVVAAGNENENFDDVTKRENDLWASLAPLENLVIVGALTKDKSKQAQSNYGSAVGFWAQGEQIPAISPTPSDLKGHNTYLRGTSFAAPIVAGKAIKLIQKNPKIKTPELIRELKNEFKKP